MNEALLGLLLSLGLNVSKIEFVGVPEYIALKDYLIKLNNVSSSTEGRITESSEAANLNGSNKDNVIVPGKYELFNNYPNPFNPVTNIKFEAPLEAKVTIKIYNITGQEVKTLFDSIVEAGIHQVLWDASNMPSGVYFCRMISGDFVKTLRMMLVK